ncbi:hypothetical protein [Desulfovibrio sp. ZJ200]|uniref:hypothetical protein n=1 Tax=Desulfovibrio sp. ZJ200 TaxID=2709792 RepID=UPI0013EDA2A5|nr:hypothetical protein [Desulfovibrio sp. ZJ200]
MTSLELLEEVKGRFVVLYHNDDTALQRLLRQALGKYQDKAGVILQSRFEAGTKEADFPELYLTVAGCHDEMHRHVPVQVDEAAGKLLFYPEADSGALTLYWLARLRDWPPDRPLPYGCVGLVGDYLEALIDIPNTSRTRDSYHGMGGPIPDLPSLQEMRARLTELEQQMEECRAILPASLVIC